MPVDRNNATNDGRTQDRTYDRDDLRIDDLRIDDLLARDQEMLCQVADERIAGGMYRRIVQAQREHRANPVWKWRWSLACAVIAVVVAVWIGMPRKTTPLAPDVANRVAPRPTTTTPGTSEAPLAKSSAKQPLRTGSHVRPTRVMIAHLDQSVAPKQAAFPSDVAPNAQERLLMQLAQNHPEQLPVIAKVISDDAQQQEDRRRAFEEWLKEGGTI
jgi:hypothetical protein